MQNLSTPEWKKGLQDENVVVLDVRTEEEFNNGYIPNAVLIDIQDPSNFTNEVQKLDKNKSYHVYCRSGKRSMLACQVMENLGFEGLANLEGGILDWDGEVIKP